MLNDVLPCHFMSLTVANEKERSLVTLGQDNPDFTEMSSNVYSPSHVNSFGGSALIPTVTGAPFITQPGSKPGRGGVWKMGATFGQYVTVTKSTGFQGQPLSSQCTSLQKSALDPTGSAVKPSENYLSSSRSDFTSSPNDYAVYTPSNTMSPYSAGQQGTNDKVAKPSFGSCLFQSDDWSSPGRPKGPSSETQSSASPLRSESCGTRDAPDNFLNNGRVGAGSPPSQFMGSMYVSNDVSRPSDDTTGNGSALLVPACGSPLEPCSGRRSSPSSSDCASSYSTMEKSAPLPRFSSSSFPKPEEEISSASIATQDHCSFSIPLSHHVPTLPQGGVLALQGLPSRFQLNNTCLDTTLPSAPTSSDSLSISPSLTQNAQKNPLLRKLVNASGASCTFYAKPSGPLKSAPSSSFYRLSSSPSSSSSSSSCATNEMGLLNRPCSMFPARDSSYAVADNTQHSGECAPCSEALNTTPDDSLNVYSTPLPCSNLYSQSSAQQNESFESSNRNSPQEGETLETSALPQTKGDLLEVPQDCCAVCWTSCGNEPMKIIAGSAVVLSVLRNDLIRCTGCGVSVHQLCYGVVVPASTLPDVTKEWYCSACDYWIRRGYPKFHRLHGTLPTQSRLPAVKCVLCKRSGGAFRIGSEQLWVHVSCVLFSTEGPHFSCPTLLQQPVDIRKNLELHRQKEFRCSICNKTDGFTVPCSFVKCGNRFHVSCAMLVGLLPQIDWILFHRTGMERMVKFLFCAIHYHTVTSSERSHYALQYQNGEDAVHSEPFKKPLYDTHPGFAPRHKLQNTESPCSRRTGSSTESVCMGSMMAKRYSAPRYEPPMKDKMLREYHASSEASGYVRPYVDPWERNQVSFFYPEGASVPRRRWNIQPVDQGVAPVVGWSFYGQQCANDRTTAKQRWRADRRRAMEAALGADDKSGVRSTCSPTASPKRRLKKNEKHGLKSTSWLDKPDRKLGPKNSFYKPACGKTATNSNALSRNLQGVESCAALENRSSRKSVAVPKSRLKPVRDTEKEYYAAVGDTAKHARLRRADKCVNDDDFESSGVGVHPLDNSSSSRYTEACRESRSAVCRDFGRTRDSRGRPRRASRVSLNVNECEKKGQAAHFGMGAHIILRGVRLKWARYNYLFKRTSFLSAVLATTRDRPPPRLEQAYQNFLSHISISSEPSLHNLAFFLLAKDPVLTMHDLCQPLVSSCPLTDSVIDEENTSSRSLSQLLLGHCKSDKRNECRLVMSFVRRSLAVLKTAAKPSSTRVLGSHRTFSNESQPAHMRDVTTLRLNYGSPPPHRGIDPQDDTDSTGVQSFSRGSFLLPSQEEDDLKLSGFSGCSVWRWETSHNGNEQFKSLVSTLVTLFSTLSGMAQEATSSLHGSHRCVSDIPSIQSALDNAARECSALLPVLALVHLFFQLKTSCVTSLDFHEKLGLFLSPNRHSVSMFSATLGISSFVKDFLKHCTFPELCRSVVYLRCMLTFQQISFSWLDPYYTHLLAGTLLREGSLQRALHNIDPQCRTDHQLSTELWAPPSFTSQNTDLTRAFQKHVTRKPTEKGVETLMEHWRNLLEVQKHVGHAPSGGASSGAIPLTTNSSGVSNAVVPAYTILKPSSRNVVAPLFSTLGDLLSSLFTGSHQEGVSSHNWLRSGSTRLRHFHPSSFCLRVARGPIRDWTNMPSQEPSYTTPGETAPTCEELPSELSKDDSSHDLPTTHKVEPSVRKNRYCLLRNMLWDMDVPSHCMDPDVLQDVLHTEVTKCAVMGDAFKCYEHKTRESEKGLAGIAQPLEDLGFVKQQIAMCLSLLKHHTKSLYAYKEMYHEAILLDEAIPRRLHEIPQAEIPVNMLFAMVSKWGRVTSQCIRGLKDHIDARSSQLSDTSPCRKVEDSLDSAQQPLLGDMYLQNENSFFSGSNSICVPNALHAVARYSLTTFGSDARSLQNPTLGNRAKMCSICFEGDWEPGNPIFVCIRCFTSVHQGCYALMEMSGDEENEPFFCKRCDLEKKRNGNASMASDYFVSGSVRCECCNTLGGALKRTVDGCWIHLTCALFLLHEILPGDIRTLDHWDLSGIQPWRRQLNCSVCAVTDWKQTVSVTSSATEQHTDVSSGTVTVTYAGKNDPFSVYHLKSYPTRILERPSDLPLFSCSAGRRGVCILCSYPGCDRSFHPFCAWMAGMYLKVTYDPSNFYPWTKTLGQSVRNGLPKPQSMESLSSRDILNGYDYCSKPSNPLEAHNLDELYFPCLRFEIYCFDHTPSSTVECESNREENDLTTRCASYQRCLRHRHFINRDLYPHLCCGSSSTSTHQQLADQNLLRKSKVKQGDLPEVPNSTADNTKASLPPLHAVTPSVNTCSSSVNVTLPSVAECLPSSLQNSKGISPVEPRSAISLHAEPQSFLSLSFDKYCDHYCAVCLTQKVPLGTPDSLSSQLRHQFVKESVLCHCRRCGLAAHPVCYNGDGFNSRSFSPQHLQHKVEKEVITSTTSSADASTEVHIPDNDSFVVMSLVDIMQRVNLHLEKQSDPVQVFFPSLSSKFSLCEASQLDRYFTCEVCSSGNLVENVACALCFRRGGAFRVLRYAKDSNDAESTTDTHTNVFIHVTCELYCPFLPLNTSNGVRWMRDVNGLFESPFYNKETCQLCLSNRGIALPCSYANCTAFNHCLCLQQHGCFLELMSAQSQDKDKNEDIPLPDERYIDSMGSFHIVNYCYHHSKQRRNLFVSPLVCFLDKTRGCLETYRLNVHLVRRRYTSKQQQILCFMENMQREMPLISVEQASSIYSVTDGIQDRIHTERGPLLTGIVQKVLDAKFINTSSCETQHSAPKHVMVYPEESVPLYYPQLKSCDDVITKSVTDPCDLATEFGPHTDNAAETLPPLTNSSLDELYRMGQSRSLTITELADLSRMLLPEYQRRRRGRPSAKEKVVRVFTAGVLEYIKSQKREGESLSDAVKRIPLDHASASGLEFWVEASFISEQYGKSLQAILCGTHVPVVDWIPPSAPQHLLSVTKATSIPSFGDVCLRDTNQHIAEASPVEESLGDRSRNQEETTCGQPSSLSIPPNDDDSILTTASLVTIDSMTMDAGTSSHQTVTTQALFSTVDASSEGSAGNSPLGLRRSDRIRHLQISTTSAPLLDEMKLENHTELDASELNDSINANVNEMSPMTTIQTHGVNEYKLMVVQQEEPDVDVEQLLETQATTLCENKSFSEKLLDVTCSVSTSTPVVPQLLNLPKLELPNTLLREVASGASVDEVCLLDNIRKDTCATREENHSEILPETENIATETSPNVHASNINTTGCDVSLGEAEAQVSPKSDNGVTSVISPHLEPNPRCNTNGKNESTTFLTTDADVVPSNEKHDGAHEESTGSPFRSTESKAEETCSFNKTQPCLIPSNESEGPLLETEVDSTTNKTLNETTVEKTDPTREGESSCIATRLRRSVRRHIPVKVESKKEGDCSLGHSAADSGPVEQWVQTINPLNGKNGSTNIVRYDDVFEAFLHMFPYTPEALQRSCMIGLYCFNQTCTDVGLELVNPPETLDNKVHRYPTALHDEGSTVMVQQINGSTVAHALHEATGLFTCVPNGLLTYQLGRSVRRASYDVSFRVLRALNCLRLAKNSNDIPLLAFLWLEAHNQYAFERIYSRALRGEIKSFEEVETDFIGVLKPPPPKMTHTKREAVLTHFYLLGKSFNEKGGTPDNGECSGWSPKRASSQRNLKRQGPNLQSSLEDILQYLCNVIDNVLQQTENQDAPLKIPYWDSVNLDWSGSLCFSALAVGTSCRIFHVDTWRWKQALIVTYDGAPADPATLGNPALVTSSKCTPAIGPLAWSLKKKNKSQRAAPPCFTKVVPSLPQIPQKHPKVEPVGEQPAVQWTHGYLVLYEKDNVHDEPLFEWRSIATLDIVEFKTRYSPNISRLLALDTEYHIRALVCSPLETPTVCIECGTSLVHYWEDDNPSEFIVCRCVKRSCEPTNKSDVEQANNRFILDVCRNVTCRDCVTRGERQQLVVDGVKPSTIRLESIWKNCTLDACWSCRTCRQLVATDMTNDAGSTPCALTHIIRKTKCRRPLDCSSVKDNLDFKLKPVLRCKTFASTACCSNEYKLKQQRQKSTWRLSLGSSEKKRGQGDTKELQCKRVLKKIRKQR